MTYIEIINLLINFKNNCCLKNHLNFDPFIGISSKHYSIYDNGVKFFDKYYQNYDQKYANLIVENKEKIFTKQNINRLIKDDVLSNETQIDFTTKAYQILDFNLNDIISNRDYFKYKIFNEEKDFIEKCCDSYKDSCKINFNIIVEFENQLNDSQREKLENMFKEHFDLNKPGKTCENHSSEFEHKNQRHFVSKHNQIYLFWEDLSNINGDEQFLDFFKKLNTIINNKCDFNINFEFKIENISILDKYEKIVENDVKQGNNIEIQIGDNNQIGININSKNVKNENKHEN